MANPRARIFQSMTTIAGGMGLYILWSVAWVPAFFLPVAQASLLLIAVAAASLWWYARPATGPRRQRLHARLQLRAPRISMGLLAMATILVVIHDAPTQTLYLDWFNVPSDPDNPLLDLAAKPHGWIPLALLAVLVGPLIEEFMLRGWIQGPLVRLWGSFPGILIASMLFALLHGPGPRLLYYTIAGMVFGYAVHLSRSVWTGVLLHSASNAAAGLLNATGIETQHIAAWFDSWGGAGALPLFVLLTSAAIVWVFWKMSGDSRRRPENTTSRLQADSRHAVEPVI